MYANSCDWFFDTKEYQAIVNSADPYSLRIVGRLREGKTILSSSIIRKFENEIPGRTLFFFCKSGDAEKRLPIHVMRAVLSRLLRLDESTYPLVER